MLADTPPTLFLFLTWALLACAAPFFGIIGTVLAARHRTRRTGIVLLLSGVAGAVFGAVGDALFAVLVGAKLSDATAAGWIFASFGGFSLFFTCAAFFGYVRRR